MITFNQPCATPTVCYMTDTVGALGHKTIDAEVTGTCPVKAACQVVAPDSSIILESTDLSSTHVAEFNTWCDKIGVCIGPGATGSTVTSWGRADSGVQRSATSP